MPWTKGVVVHRRPAMEGAAQLCHALRAAISGTDSRREGHGEGAESLGELTGIGLGRKRDVLRPTAMNGGGRSVMLIDAVVEPWRTTCGGGRN
jgi:hypothetical protein